MLTRVLTYRTGATQPIASRKFEADGRRPPYPRATLARMTNDTDAPAEISDADLEQWYRVHNGKDADGQTAGIGIQARDRLIRKLIEEVRRLRDHQVNSNHA